MCRQQCAVGFDDVSDMTYSASFCFTCGHGNMALVGLVLPRRVGFGTAPNWGYGLPLGGSCIHWASDLLRTHEMLMNKMPVCHTVLSSFRSYLADG